MSSLTANSLIQGGPLFRGQTTTITLLYPVQGNYTTAISSCLSQITGRSVELSEVWFEDGKWRSIITGFQFVKSGVLVETTGYAETSDLNTPFTILPVEWPLPLNNKLKTWDQVSAENFKLVRVL